MEKSVLLLEDGTRFEGISLGGTGQTVGLLMVYDGSDYMRMMCDPSNAGYIVAMVPPGLGSWGVNTEFCESGKCWLQGIAASTAVATPKNWRSAESVDSFLRRNLVPGIIGLDMAELRNYVHKNNIRKAAVINVPGFDDWSSALSLIKNFRHKSLFPNAVKVPESYGSSYDCHLHIGICDFGASRNLARLLSNMRFKITLLPPYDTPAIISRGGFDALIVPHCSGSPRRHPGVIEGLQNVIESKIPVLGIGTGCAFLALACGAKLNSAQPPHFGNALPVEDLSNGQIMITRQVHDFNIEPGDIFTVTHRSVHDGTYEAFRHKEKNVICQLFLPAGDARIASTGAALGNFFAMIGGNKR